MKIKIKRGRKIFIIPMGGGINKIYNMERRKKYRWILLLISNI